jgi:urea-proton symporter
MIFVARCVVIGYGILSGVMAIILLKIGLSLGWVYLFMGIVIGSAVVPIAFSITWAGCTAAGAMLGAVGGLAGAVITWVCVAKGLYGAVTIDTLGNDFPMLAGNLVAIIFSAIICTIVSLVKPQNYNWEELAEIPLVEDDPNAYMSQGEDSPEAMTKALRYTWITGGGLTILLVILWPLLALPAGVFNR